MADDTDSIEQSVLDALKEAYRDGPEFMALRQAVMEMVEDRRKLRRPTAEMLDEMIDQWAENMSKGAQKAGKRWKSFAGDLRQAFDKLTQDD